MDKQRIARGFGMPRMSSSLRRIRKPNFFLAFKIDDNSLVDSLNEIQKRIILETEKGESPKCRIHDMNIALDKMHVTGILLTIDSKLMLQGIIKILEYCSKILYACDINNLSMKVHGLSSFDNGRVVYAEIEDDVNNALLKITLKMVYDQIKKEFPSALYSSKFEFIPHLTIFKAKGYCRAKVSNEFFKDFQDELFGTQIITGFDLLGTEGTKEGYYVKYATMKFDGTLDKGVSSCR